MENIMPGLAFRSLDDFSERLEDVINSEKIDINQPVLIAINNCEADDYLIVLAARLNCSKIVEWLIEREADVFVCDESELNAYNYAVINNNTALANKIKQYEIDQKRLISEKAHEMVEIFYTKDSLIDISNQIEKIPSHLLEPVQTEFADRIQTQGVDLGSIRQRLQHLDTPSFYFILSSLDNLVGGQPQAEIYLGLLGYEMVFGKLILETIIPYIDPDSTQLVAFDKAFNPMQTFLIFYESDEKHYDLFIQFLTELKEKSSDSHRHRNLLDFTNWITNNDHCYVKQEVESTNDSEQLLISATNKVTSNYTEAIDYGLHHNYDTQYVMEKYAIIDNALMLIVKNYNNKKSRLIYKLAEKSGLHCLAEAVMSLCFLKSINTKIEAPRTVQTVYPAFFPEKNTCEEYVSQLAEGYNCLEDNTVPVPARLVFLFCSNTHETDVVEHQLLQGLFNLFISRCNNLSKEQSKRSLMRILEIRGEAFYDKKQYVWASYSFRAAQLFYSMLKQPELNDHASIIRLFYRCGESLKNIDHEFCLSLSQVNNQACVQFIRQLFEYNNLSNDDKQFLTNQSEYQNILLQPSHVANSSITTANFFTKKKQDQKINARILKILTKCKTEDPAQAFRKVASEGLLSDMRWLVEDYPHVINEKGLETGKTALHRAVIKGDVDVVSYLVCELKVDTHIKDNDGKIAFEYINTHCDQPKIVETLEKLFASTTEDSREVRKTICYHSREQSLFKHSF